MSKEEPKQVTSPAESVQKENAFDMGIAGTTGAMDYSTGFGTFASPDASQNPAAFLNSKALGSHSNTAASAPAQPMDVNATVDQIYSKEVTPSPDEVKAGLDYELHNMTKKDKGKAKELVLGNLKKDPHYYGKLKMLNIDDEEMMKENTEPMSKSEEQMMERVKLLNQMMESKGKKAETPQSIKDALAETRAKKAQRYTR